MRWISALVLLLITTCANSAVYQYQDEEGNIIFSDKPVPGSVERKVESPAIIKIQKDTKSKTPEKSDESAFGDVKIKEKKPKPYKLFSMASPKDDESIRENLGNVSVALKISPDLQTEFGHRIMIEFDGKLLEDKWKSNVIAFSNVDRGTHSLKAHLIDTNGNRLKSTPIVTFHLQRFSRFNR